MRFIFVTLNNADQAVSMDLKTEDCTEYIGALTGEKVSAKGGRIRVKVAANYGEIWIPEEIFDKSIAPIKPMEIIKKSPKMQVRKNEQTKMKTTVPLHAKEKSKPEKAVIDWTKPYEEMTIEELQEAILEKMRKNGPVTDYMLGTVRENTHKGSLITWVKSFI